ncbi:hypothetical protein Desdi_2239 [Desulfitobacterium dichloroeliminans LMG P-21439]|uniref:Uncharacterized protein n=1 Tax=Desulfitobacterium dichloroeliminans (strain LMG P-21439 / DCA1) TaxID=871963 RepID=L0F9H4_DESDL|nr:hypothetical protein [Desulfitobacterium dichloroeliminans]AGA69670.1 hypothetical protein Desdi_2239 [Desulfitobacterium dichloroeliminans LMG P-21439]
MGSSWESLAVAIVIILLFYFGKRFAPQLKETQKRIKVKQPKDESKAMAIILSKKENKAKATQPRPSHSSSTVASLVLHPHTFERAKREYIQYAQRFLGAYELLYLSCYGNIGGERKVQLINNWEEGILSTDAPNFILAWNTCVQKHCGRNFYGRGNSKGNSKEKIDYEMVDLILQDWLKLLLRWGLHREPRGYIQSELQGGEPIGTTELNYYWLLNGEVLEEGQLKAQSLGQ